MQGTLLQNRFLVLREIGKGGMGVVYQAVDQQDNTLVAIKTLAEHPFTGQETMARFSREARTLAQMQHPNIVRFLDAFHEKNCYFIAFEYVDGSTLSQLLHNVGQFNPQHAVKICIQVCAALQYAHTLPYPIYHRDIKPSNIMQTREGAIKLTDFGIARDSGATIGLTREGMTPGTPTYMSPEQAQGQQIDGRSDIYSLGIALFEMVIGGAPFGGDNAHAVLHKQIYEAPPAPRTINDRIPPRLEQVILQALAKERAQRYQTAAAFADALTTTLESEQRSAIVTPNPSAPHVLQQTDIAIAQPPHDGNLSAPEIDRPPPIPPQPRRDISLIFPLLLAGLGGLALLAFFLLSAFGQGFDMAARANPTAGESARVALASPTATAISTSTPTPVIESATPLPPPTPIIIIVNQPTAPPPQITTVNQPPRIITRVVPPSNISPEPPPANNCSITLPTRVTVGIPARGTTLRIVRVRPGFDAPIATRVPKGILMQILAGPQCASNVYWWQVRLENGSVAWAAESQDGEYLFEPWADPPPPPDQTTAAKAVEDYYAAIIRREYDVTWNTLSLTFKRKFNCCTAAGEFDRAQYEVWWNKVKTVHLSGVALVDQSATHATVFARLQYTLFDGRVINEQSHIFLTDDSGRWLFDDKRNLR